MRIIQVTPNELKQIINEILDTKINEIVNSSQQQSQPEFLNRKETRELLGVSYVTLNNWHRKGILEPKYLGNKLFYDKNQIVSLLSNK
jgi:hypothetical protein